MIKSKPRKKVSKRSTKKTRFKRNPKREYPLLISTHTDNDLPKGGFKRDRYYVLITPLFFDYEDNIFYRPEEEGILVLAPKGPEYISKHEFDTLGEALMFIKNWWSKQ